MLDERTVQAPSARDGEGGSIGPREPARAPLAALLWRGRWVLGIGLMLLIGLVVVRWANTRPGYDPYGWLVWGHLTIHGKLDTNGAPSWKPLPFLFTVPYALVGQKAMWLWMITAITVSLSGLVFAARIAFKLAAPDGERRWAGYLAGVFAAAFLFMIRDYTHYMLSAQSDTMIVSLCLGAIDCHLYGRRRWAFTLLLLAALGRPEAWPALGLYGIWCWRRVPGARALVAFGFVLIPAFWFGIPALTSKSWFTAGNIALKSPRALHENKFVGEIDRFLDLHETVIYLGALVMVAIAALRRERATIVIALAAVLWVAVEVGFVLHGWPGVPRYLFEAGGVTAVLAGAAVGRLAVELPSLLGRIVPRIAPLAGTAAALLIALVVAGSLVPVARSRVNVERADLTHERYRTKIINDLEGLIARLGGRKKLFYCGQPTTGIGLQSVLAWEMGVNTGVLFWTPHLGNVDPRPVVLFRVTPHAWKVTTIDTSPAKKAACKKLNTVSLLAKPA